MICARPLWGGGLKNLNVMAQFKQEQETHRKGVHSRNKRLSLPGLVDDAVVYMFVLKQSNCSGI